MKTYFRKIFRILLTILLLSITLLGSVTIAENNTAIPGESPSSEAGIQVPEFDGPFYLELNLPKKRLYIGERIPVRIVLYLRDIEVSVVDEPVLSQPEFLFDKLRNPAQKHFLLNHEQYQVIEFAYLLTPVKTGNIPLGPIKQNCYFTPDGSYKRRMVETTTSKRNVQVLSLPKSPADFSGGVGNFQLSINATPSTMLQGEPVIVKMTLSGYGNLQSVSAPVLKNSEGLKIFKAQKKTISTTPNSLWQQITFEQVIIPVDTKLKRIGPYSFTYFEPGSGKYKKIVSSAIAITVKPNPNFKVNRSNEPQPLSEKIKPLKVNSGALRIKTLPLLQQIWFWVLQVIPLLFLTGAAIYRRNREDLESDSPKGRALRATLKAKQQLAAARELLSEGGYQDLLENSILILREYLGERFGLPSAGITGTIINELERQGLSPEILKNIQFVFDQYDLHHFAGAQLKEDEASKLLKLVTETIESLNAITSVQSIVNGKE